MWNFQDIFETRKRSFISTFSICMTVPLREITLHCFLRACSCFSGWIFSESYSVAYQQEIALIFKGLAMFCNYCFILVRFLAFYVSNRVWIFFINFFLGIEKRGLHNCFLLTLVRAREITATKLLKFRKKGF